MAVDDELVDGVVPSTAGKNVSVTNLDHPSAYDMRSTRARETTYVAPPIATPTIIVTTTIVTIARTIAARLDSLSIAPPEVLVLRWWDARSAGFVVAPT